LIRTTYALRCSLLTLLGVSTLVVWSLTRITLWAITGPGQMGALQATGAAALGLLFDLATLAFALCPFFLLALLMPKAWRASPRYALARWVVYALVLYALVFGAIAEVVFWLEFSTRFNFIAVDYLVYTHEVVGNIKESYPVPGILMAIAVGVVFVVALVRRVVRLTDAPMPRWGRAKALVLGVVAAVASAAMVSIDHTEFSENAYANELAGNGLYGFSAAFRRNDLDYDKFYAQVDEKKAQAVLGALGVLRDGQGPTTERAPQLTHPGWLKTPKNVVLISVESLSASFLGAYGSTLGLTPQLDRLSKEGVLLQNLFATGTRTVRGLEALSLGTPPVPGQAIVHRPGNDNLSTLGNLLNKQGFDTHWIYGGYGYFDNMNAYFKGNHHTVADRTDFPKASIAGENIWGVADESLFDNALTVLDRSQANGKRFFAHIMTTSNHRPYTFPEGRIDLPQGERNSAVKYTDYAIGRFIEQAKSKPWFNDTLFVVVADHCASVAGKSKLPVASYRIAGLFYGPQLLKAGIEGRLLSQIDIPPTLLDVLGINGSGLFYGQSFANSASVTAPGRAFISNYQELGYYKNNQLVVLSPKRKVAMYAIDPVTKDAAPVTVLDEVLVTEAIAYYQSASRSYKTGKLKLPS
jgi:phosphoglycerol transferase MdoB-like AlkP superfamily enzyme